MKKQRKSATQGVRWWREDGEALGRAVLEWADGLERDYDQRGAMHDELIRRYECRSVGHDAWGYLGGYIATTFPVEGAPIAMPYERSLCDTAQSQIAAAQRPMPAFLTDGADWSTRRRAMKLGRFVEAILRQPHGVYADGWDMCQDAFLDAEIVGTGCVRVDPDEGDQRIRLTRIPAREVYVDPDETKYGECRTLAHRYDADRDVLADTYPEHADEIYQATGKRRDGVLGASRESVGVEVIEVWRLNGKHALVLSGSGTVLLEETWKHGGFPIAFLRWTPDRFGFWGTGLVAELAPLADSLREQADRMRRRAALCSQRRVYAPRGSLKPDELFSENAAETLIEYDGPSPPVETVVEALSQSEWQHFQHERSELYALAGISESTVSARKEPGVNAAVAMRELNNVQSRRLQRVARAYEMFFCDLGRAIVRTAADAGAMVARWPGKSFTRQIKWSDVSMEEDAFTVTVAPVSSLPNDPAGRLAMAQELMSAGAIDAAAFKRLLAMPDVEREQSHATAEYEWVEDYLDRLLDAGTQAEAESIYEAPDGFLMSMPTAYMQAVGAYYQAKLMGAPPHNLDALRKWITDINEIMQRAQQAAAAAAAPPPAAPPMLPGA